MKYVKKPIVVEAFRYGHEDFPGWMADADYYINKPHDWLVIMTLEGDMAAQKGDYIIKGIKGEFYPCKPDIFEASYDPVGA
jgi:hypothetical protein